jgi:hypothetical protein
LSDKEVEEVDLDVDGNIVDDDINNDNIKFDIDDDVDMANPFNVDFEPDDTYVEMNEEEDK